MKTAIGIDLDNIESVQMEVHTVNHLTNELKVADLTESNPEQVFELQDEWKKLDTLVEANFIEPNKAKRLKSGFYLLDTKAGQMVAGLGEIVDIQSNQMQVGTTIVLRSYKSKLNRCGLILKIGTYRGKRKG